MEALNIKKSKKQPEAVSEAETLVLNIEKKEKKEKQKKLALIERESEETPSPPKKKKQAAEVPTELQEEVKLPTQRKRALSEENKPLPSTAQPAKKAKRVKEASENTASVALKIVVFEKFASSIMLSSCILSAGVFRLTKSSLQLFKLQNYLVALSIPRVQFRLKISLSGYFSCCCY
jgi:hypothetical protein